MKKAIPTSLVCGIALALSVHSAWAQYLPPGDATYAPSDTGEPYYSSQPSLTATDVPAAETYPASSHAQQLWDEDATPADGGCATGKDSVWGLGHCLSDGGCGCWTATVAGLSLRRHRGNDVWLSFDTADITSALLGTSEADNRYNGGVETRLRREFGCNSALELVYWGRFHDSASATVTDAAVVGALNTSIDMTGVTFAGGDDVVDWFDDAASHTVQRDLEFHNVELNFVRDSLCNDACSAWAAEWFLGVRFFKMDEGLLFSSVAGAAGGPGGTATPGGVASLDIDTENNLVGVQIGTRLDYFLTQNLSFYITPSVGLYGNNMDLRFHVYNDEGEDAFDIRSSRNDVSFLTQVDVGAAWQLSRRWRVFGGYRAVAVTGLALPDEQIPPFLADTAGIADIEAASSTILHGGFAGFEFAF